MLEGNPLGESDSENALTDGILCQESEVYGWKMVTIFPKEKFDGKGSRRNLACEVRDAV